MMHSVRNINRQDKNAFCCNDCDRKPKSRTIRTREKRQWKKEIR